MHTNSKFYEWSERSSPYDENFNWIMKLCAKINAFAILNSLTCCLESSSFSSNSIWTFIYCDIRWSHLWTNSYKHNTAQHNEIPHSFVCSNSINRKCKNTKWAPHLYPVHEHWAFYYWNYWCKSGRSGATSTEIWVVWYSAKMTKCEQINPLKIARSL